ncbi:MULTISPECIES: hypothetical protein [Streptomyces]|uniref:Uncharacterized protein n=2 Tax=Streptomyces TaxID=1883 RepID=A0A1D8G294_9ACTN|nr:MULTISPECIES: hypothetical protein [Streptomyces]AOT59563.1 hypothetical protein A4G23_02405 [Streptomyces rubrolavendulae]KAF0651051.1 hypothetical protein K701_04565 [Streptomyces fradiae ATCC 10745 = DSM 40063]OSY53924.1 hypothetical protein BG846_00409 [Streptomyces fradiae ATCC 10745 = DSM 40063]QEV12804.1 hypothetical protein CP974_13200 [Streptomyces fradiae ATCC 10745 = DSM 40063]UQS31940.1 hypothetical protein J5J01_10345 [Streptomyces fradiae]
MSTATFTPATRTGPRTPQAPGAGTRPVPPVPPASGFGGALRAVRVFTAAAFGVAVLGDYDADAAGVRRR